MSTPFDATTKELVRFQPADWLLFLGLPLAPCALVDTDLATVSTEVDRLIRVAAEPPYLVHIEFQAGHDGYRVPGRLLRYNVLVGEQTGLAVLSYVVLLRHEADSPSLTGKVERHTPDGAIYLTFRYSVVRLWEMPVEHILSGGLALLPLALLCDFSGLSPEHLVRQLEKRITAEAEPSDQRKLWASTYLLAGVRFAPAVAGKLLERAVAQMKESMTYQHILAEGRQEGISQGIAEGITQGITQGIAQGEREFFLRLARRRLGEPDAQRLALVEAASQETLERWADQLLVVESWQALMEAPHEGD